MVEKGSCEGYTLCAVNLLEDENGLDKLKQKFERMYQEPSTEYTSDAADLAAQNKAILLIIDCL